MLLLSLHCSVTRIQFAFFVVKRYDICCFQWEMHATSTAHNRGTNSSTKETKLSLKSRVLLTSLSWDTVMLKAQVLLRLQLGLPISLPPLLYQQFLFLSLKKSAPYLSSFLIILNDICVFNNKWLFTICSWFFLLQLFWKNALQYKLAVSIRCLFHCHIPIILSQPKF